MKQAIGFVILGLSMASLCISLFIFSYEGRKAERERCTLEVKAVCVGNTEREETYEDSDGKMRERTVYTPIFEYVVDDRTYLTSVDDLLRNEAKPFKKGRKAVLYVDPYSPLTVFPKKDKFHFFYAIMILGSVLGIYLIAHPFIKLYKKIKAKKIRNNVISAD